MNYGFKIVFHKDIEYNSDVAKFLNKMKEWFCSENSYKCRKKSWAFFRRRILGYILGSDFKMASSKNKAKYTFRRISTTKRIFALVPIDKICPISGDKLELDGCICAEHLGGQRVTMKPYDENDYITYFETGKIKG